jgi:Ran GTPase-activating protein (RanGAP) involved in mRNA processing and transport
MGNSGSRGGGGGGSRSSSNTGSYTCKSQGGRSWKDNDGVTNICISVSSTGNSGNNGSGSYPSGNSNSRGGEGRGGNSGSSSTNQESSSQNTYSSGDNYVIQELTTNFNKWQNLSYIDFSGKQLGDDSGKQFNEAFRDAKLPNLLTLVLTNNQIGDSGAQYLVQSLIHHYNNNLTTLILANNNLTNNGVTPFADGFNQINTTIFPNGAISSGQITKLKTLDLRRNDKVCFIGKLYFFKNIDKCKTKDTSILFDEFTIKTSNAHSLNLSNTLLSNDHYGFFSASFNSGYLSSLHTLVLSNNKMGDTGSLYLAKSLINHYCNNLTTLSLANNNLTNNGITPFADGLSSGKITKLKYLDLRENSKICFSGMLYFFKDIDKCKTKDTSILFDKVTINTGDIHSLGLNNKLLNDSHIPWITGAFNLKWLATIHNLNLGNNKIGDEGAKLLADSLLNGRFPHLKTLRLEGNKITDEGQGFLIDSLKVISQHIVVKLKKYSVDLGQKTIKPALKEFINFAEKRGVNITDINTDKSTIESLKDMARVGWDLSFGIAKCRYPALEVLTLDTTLPSLVIETAVEKSGSKVLKNANMGLCISITTYDAFTTPAGLDLIVKAIDLMGEE